MKDRRERIHITCVKKYDDEEGATLVTVALLMTVLISMVALVVDLGYAYYNKSMLQASCDAAALAAANYLEIYSQSDVRTKGKECFDKNISSDVQERLNVQNDESNYEIIEESGKDVKIKVSATLESPTGFATIFGVDHVNVGAYAVAEARQGPPDSIWRYAMFSNNSMSFSTGHIDVEGAIGSNENIELGNVPVDIVETGGTYPVAGKIVAAGTIGGTDFVTDGTEIRPNASHYEFEDYCEEFSDWVDDNIRFNTSSLPSFDSPGTDISDDEEWDIVGTDAKLNRAARYELGGGNFYMSPSGTARIVVPHNIYVDGNATFDQHLVIETGATLYITGNCVLNNNFTCNGNIIVEGNVSMNGGTFNSTSAGESIIYVKGTGGTSLGTAGTTVNNVVIVAPNCSSLSINGGGNTIVGCIVGNTISSPGSGTIKVKYPGERYPWERDSNGVRLVE